jgi:hypothetical protein
VQSLIQSIINKTIPKKPKLSIIRTNKQTSEQQHLTRDKDRERLPIAGAYQREKSSPVAVVFQRGRGEWLGLMTREGKLRRNR